MEGMGMTQVNVFYMSGERVDGNFFVWPNLKVEELADDISSKINIPVIYMDLMWRGMKLNLDRTWAHYEDMFDDENPSVQLVVRVPELETVLKQMCRFEERIVELERTMNVRKRDRNQLRNELEETRRQLEDLLNPAPDPDALPMRDYEDSW